MASVPGQKQSRRHNGAMTFDRAHADVCDRRLSRAARAMLQRHVLPLLLHYHKGRISQVEHEDISSSLAPTSLYKALETAISPDKLNVCPLNPRLDLFRNHEEHSEKIHTGPSFRLPYRNMRHAYTCNLCGKTFLTRYYLDVHLDNHHSQIESGDDENYTCPAISWCNALGGWGACQLEALELEPYYGRGSGGFGRDASKVRHEWYRIAHSWRCTEESMLESQQVCREVMSLCFEDELAQDLIHAVCDGLTCQDALHKLLGVARRHVHTWKEEWNMHSRGHSLGIGGSLVILLLFGFYAHKGIQQRKKRRTTKSGQLYSTNNSASVKKRLVERRNKNKMQ